MPGRERSSTASAILNPAPSSPSRLATGTFTSSNTSCAVGEPRIPSLCSSFGASHGLFSRSSTNAEMPLWLASGSVWANTTSVPAMLPPVMNCLVPLRTYSLPWRLARVFIAAASEPLPVSESAYAATCSPDARGGQSRFFCSSEPATRIGYDPSAWTARISDEVAQALAISSMPMQMVTLEPEMPPYSSGKGMPRMPFSAKSLSMSFGYSAFSSISAARGATLSCTSSRIVSRIAICSSEKSKSIALLLDHFSGDHDSLDLVRALVDLQRLGVANVAFEWTARHHTLLPGDLHRVQCNLHRGVGGVQLRHRRFASKRATA